MKKLIILLIIFLGISADLFSKVYVITVKGGISPATSSFISGGIELAEKERAEALIIELNTPGGLLESTRDIVQSIISSKVPVIVYVGPSGARAGSAGVFITLSSNIAVMAPGTNIGAAHPVGLGGESDTNVMYDKITNDAAAFVRSIAQKRGRNVEWAELSVRESISSSEKEALEIGVINYICPNIDSLLIAVHSDTVETEAGIKVLNTKNSKYEYIEMSWKDELLGIISDPNVAYLLLMAGIYGILFELYSPGAIFPGVLGGISIILAGYSLQMLPINYAGLALILLAIILFILEIKVQSYGMLTVGGVLSLFFGSIMLIDSPGDFMEISTSLIITTVVFTTIFFLVIISIGIKAQYQKRASGIEGIKTENGIALTEISPNEFGKVKVHGEIWKAKSDDIINKGDEVIVQSIDSLTLTVSKK